MKHTKFCKLLSVVLTVVMVMLSSVSVFAGSTLTASQDIATTEVNLTYTVTAEGINPVGLAVVMIGPATEDAEGNLVFDETKDIISGMQVFVDENGSYTGKFVLSSDTDADGNSVVKAGYYKIVASSNDEVVDTVIYFAAPSDRKGALKRILEATDDATVVSVIDSSANMLGIDEDIWDLLPDTKAKEKAAKAIRANAVMKTIDKNNIKDADVAKAADQINKEALTAILNADKGVVSDLNDYKDVIDNTDAMTLYDGLKDDAKKEMIKLISGKNYENYEALDKDLGDMARLAYINADGSDIDTVSKYAKDLDLDKADDFDKIASSRLKKEAIDAVKAAKATTIEDLNKAFTKAVNARLTGGSSGGVADRDNSGSGNGSGNTTIIKSDTVNPDDSKALDYIDIDNYPWAKDSINELTKLNVLTGYGDRLFGPANPIKREEFAKVIVAAMYGEEADKANVVPAFVDAQNAWYSSYVGYGAQIGIISGYSADTFGVGQNIKRQDIMAILYRIMVAKGYAVNTTPIAYSDAADIYDYAKDAVYALANAGVVSGYNGAINPNGEATRAEVAVMVANFIKLF